MHIYAFGSICRGDVDASSDVDMLAVVNGRDEKFNPRDYSVYSYKRLRELWDQGSPFAWHLFLESRLVYSSDKADFIQDMNQPNSYRSGLTDCENFYKIFLTAKESLGSSDLTEIFDLSSVFLGVRNFATCYSLHCDNKPDFSRNSALNLGVNSLPMEYSNYNLLERARILCTRGEGELLSATEINNATIALSQIDCWMRDILNTLKSDGYERV